MRLVDHETWIRVRLDLRDWWEKVWDANEAQSKFIDWDRGPFWWYDETKQHIITLKNWKMASYKVADTILVLPSSTDKRLWAIRKTTADLNIILRLNYKNRVKNREEAEERFSQWEKEVFWMITADRKTIATLDFVSWKKPIITEYPKDKTNIRFQAIAI